MKYYLISTLGFIIFLIPQLQAQNLDSLINIIERQKPEEKQVTLNQIIITSCYNNPDTAIYYAKELRRISSELDDSIQVARADFLMGACYQLKTEYKKAIDYYEKAYQVYLNANEKKGISNCLNNLGIIYKLQGNLKAALEYYLKSLEIYEEVATPFDIAASYTNIGLIYSKLGGWHKSKEYHIKANKIYQDAEAHQGIGLSFMNLGSVYLNTNQYDSALFYFNNSIEVYKTNNIKYGLQKSLLSKGLIFENMNQPDSAYHYYQQSLKIAKEIQNQVSIAVALIHISKIEGQRGNNKKAIQLAKEGLATLNEAGDVAMLANAYRILSEAYYKTGNLDRAYQNLTDFIMYQDSASAIDTKSIIAEMEYKYESDKIEEENRFLKSENELKETLIKTQNTRLWIIIIALGALLAFTFVLYNITRKLKKANTNLSNSYHEIEKQKRQLEILNQTKDKLFSIIGHDLRGPIGNIKSLMDIILDDSDSLSKDSMLEILYLTRDTSNKTLLSLENLLVWARTQKSIYKLEKTNLNLKDVVEESIELVKSSALRKNISLSTNIADNSMVFADKNMLHVIIRNITSNALKFTEESGSVTIEDSDYNDVKKLVSIKDTGIGMDEKETKSLFTSKVHKSRDGTNNEKGTGLGLQLCKEFIDKEGEKIWVESKKGIGTTFYFTISKPIQA